jgi:dienelactone hydrolase
MAQITWSQGQFGAKDFLIENDKSARPVTGALWLPKNAPPELPVVLCGHGASGDRYQAPIPLIAEQLCDFATLSIDGPVHGMRRVEPGGREAFFKEMQRPEFIDDMVEDWLVAYEACLPDRGITTTKLGYFGLSMGTMFGIPLLASRLQFDAAVIGLCGSTGAASLIGPRLLSDAKRIEHPIFFIMQLEDELFDREGYLALFDEIQSKDKRLHANPGLHPEVPAEEINFSTKFLSRKLTRETKREIINPLAE